MNSGIRRTLSFLHRSDHKLHGDAPTDTLKKKILDMEKKRKQRNKRKGELFVEVPESKAFLNTATLPMILTVVGTAFFAKILTMVDDARSQEMIERKIKKCAA